MNDAQKVQAAYAHLRRMQVTFAKWEENVRAGKYANPGATEGGKAKALLDQIGQPAPTPPPPATSTLAQLATNVVFCAQRSEEALNAPPRFKVALTADPAYASWATPEIVARFRAQGRKVFAWGVQTQIGAAKIHELRNRLDLDGEIFQGETAEEYDTAIRAGADLIVGNPNAWTDAQRHEATHMVSIGQLAVIAECYTNLGGPWPEAYSSQGVPVASLCLGVYDGSSEVPGSGWNPTLAAYKQHTPPAVWPGVGVYHAAGVPTADWAFLA